METHSLDLARPVVLLDTLSEHVMRDKLDRGKGE